MAKRRAMGSNVLDTVAGLEEKAPAQAAPEVQKAPKAAGSRYTERQTYHMDPELVTKIRGVAWWDRVTVADVVNEAVRQYVERIEKKRGEPYAPVKEARKGRPIR